jgi:adenosine/AMP kinase
MVELKIVDVEVPEGTNVIVGRTHFIKSVEDIYEALITSCPSIKFGIGFCEASQDRLVRHEGNDKSLESLAAESCLKAGVGHMFIIYIKDAWPINVLNRLKHVMEVVSIDAATANPVQLIVAETDQGRALLGVVDGYTPVGIEDSADKKKRMEFLRKIGYKLG